MAIKCLQLMSWFFGQPVPRTVVNLLILIGSLFGAFWTVLEAAGVPGSTQTIGLLAAFVIGLVSAFVIGSWLLRWSLLYPAIKSYVRNHLAGRVIRDDTVLVAAGTGGAIVLGMVAKALQELGHLTPRILVLDLVYRANGTLDMGTLLPNDFNLVNTSVFIITSYVGTGSALRTIRSRLKTDGAPAFSVVVSNAAKDRELINHYLIVGSRAVIPWEKSVAMKNR